MVPEAFSTSLERALFTVFADGETSPESAGKTRVLFEIREQAARTYRAKRGLVNLEDAAYLAAITVWTTTPECPGVVTLGEAVAAWVEASLVAADR